MTKYSTSYAQHFNFVNGKYCFLIVDASCEYHFFFQFSQNSYSNLIQFFFQRYNIIPLKKKIIFSKLRQILKLACEPHNKKNTIKCVFSMIDKKMKFQNATNKLLKFLEIFLFTCLETDHSWPPIIQHAQDNFIGIKPN